MWEAHTRMRSMGDPYAVIQTSQDLHVMEKLKVVYNVRDA
jgi:hypothetical protein